VLAVASLEGGAGKGAVRKGQGAQARAEAKSKAIESGSVRDSVDIVSDAGDAVGAVSGTAFGVGNGGWSVAGLGSGFASASGGGNAQAFGSSPSPVGSGLAPIVPAFLQKLKVK
jgi:hypothetical protein